MMVCDDVLCCDVMMCVVQAGSLVLLTLLTWSVHTLKFVKRLPPSTLANATHKAAPKAPPTAAAAAIKPH